MTVQGGPGTGKTAVGLHRAAFLLYNHPPLAQAGVLVVGPSRAFLRYIAQVLPALGEEAVIQTTIADLVPRVRVTGEDPLPVRRLKGDPRLASVLARALDLRRGRVEDGITLRARSIGCTLAPDEVNQLVGAIAGGPSPYKAGRSSLRARLVSLVRQKLRQSGHIEANEPWLERELTATDTFRSLLDHLWPAVSPTALVGELLASPERLRAAGAVLDEDERGLLRRPARSRSAAWTTDDLQLIDEAEHLINGRRHTYGHIVVDEAQDLSPMQFRMLARRAPAGSLTVLGDLAQATGAWSYEHWHEILSHLPEVAPVRSEELTLGYRAPGQVLDLASRLLPLAAPTIRPTRSIRRGGHDPLVISVEHSRLLGEALEEAGRLAAAGLLVGVVAPAGHLAGLSALAEGRRDVGLLDRDGMAKPITLVAAEAVKGLEFDAVVVVEPAAIAGRDRRGLRTLYVAMTRPIRHLTIVHAEPLPAQLLPPRATDGDQVKARSRAGTSATESTTWSG